MDVKQLREVIEDALVSIVGTYTLPNNTTLPAFYVDGQYGVPKDWKIQGLEVVIQEFPRQTLAHASVRALSESFGQSS